MWHLNGPPGHLNPKLQMLLERRGTWASSNLHITGSYLGLGCGLGCVQEGVKWRGHRPPTLARSVLAAQLFSVQSRPCVWCSSGGAEEPARVRPQSPPSGLSCSSQPLHSSSPSVQVEQPPHCSVSAHHKSAALEQTKERSTFLSTGAWRD